MKKQNTKKVDWEDRANVYGDLIDLYEQYTCDVSEALRFTRMGCGKKHHDAFDILKELLDFHYKDLMEKIEKRLDTK